jgi:SAM-dependent methyltransferase
MDPVQVSDGCAEEASLSAMIQVEPARLTDERFWDEYWGGIELPQEFTDANTSPYIREFLATFDRYFPPASGLSALEIGGAPGRYLAYFHRRFGYDVKALDYSPVGYELARRNFELLGIQATVVQGDMFDAALEFPQCDIVYSLGLIEHFDDPAAVAKAHLRFVKPGGLLAIGAPNMRGLSGLLHRWLSPSVLESLYVPSTDPHGWDEFERELGLHVLWKGYISGFEPSNFWRLERRNPFARALWWFLHGLSLIWERRALRRLRRVNSWAWSSYVIAFYRAPDRRPLGGAATSA